MNPRPIANGYVRCEGDWLHRPERAACPINVVYDQGGAGGLGGGGAGGGEGGSDADGIEFCTRDSSCTSRPYGYCEELGVESPYWGRSVCEYGCRVDEDCSGNQICVCGPKVGRCAPAGCTSNEACGAFLCASSENRGVCSGLPEYDFACQTPNDECSSVEDCGASGWGGVVKCISGTRGRTCDGGSICGRPFLVNGQARQAPARERSSWAARQSPRLESLSSAARRALETHWTHVALLEHASIAAFARFTLELLSLGAPLELVSASQRALGDEIAHAQACFGLASAYAGRELGPGALGLDDALPADRSWRDIVYSAFLEACIGETIAAAEAEAALARAEDPAVRAVLAQIARDETRHAELGWRFLRWALERADASLREAALSELSELLSHELATEPASGSGAAWSAATAAHGLLPRDEQRAVRQAALREVVVACASALGVPLERRAA